MPSQRTQFWRWHSHPTHESTHKCGLDLITLGRIATGCAGVPSLCYQNKKYSQPRIRPDSGAEDALSASSFSRALRSHSLQFGSGSSRRSLSERRKMTIFKAAACAGLLALALSAQAEITQAATATVVAIDTKASTLTMRVKFQDEAAETQRTVTWAKAT